MAKRWRQKLDPAAGALWQDQWRAFSSRRKVPGRAQAKCVLNVRLQPYDVFVDSARNLLDEKELLSAVTADRHLAIGTEDQFSEFLRGLAGYNRQTC